MKTDDEPARKAIAKRRRKEIQAILGEKPLENASESTKSLTKAEKQVSTGPILKTFYIRFKVYDSITCLKSYKLKGPNECKLYCVYDLDEAAYFDEDDYIITWLRKDYPDLELLPAGEIEDIETVSFAEEKVPEPDMSHLNWM